MKDIRKDGIIYKGMKRGRNNLLIVNIIVTLFFVLFLSRAMPFIAGKFHGPYELDIPKFLSATKDTTINEEIEMKKRADKTILSYTFMENSYTDGNKYRFNVVFDVLKETDVKYTYEYEDAQTGEKKMAIHSVVYAGRIGDRDILVLCKNDTEPGTSVALSGIFTTPPEVVISDISKEVAQNGPITINEYIFDARGIEMETEGTDIPFMIMWIILLAVLYIKLICYYINPSLHPTYKRIEKYGELTDIINNIEEQFASDKVQREGKELITQDWIMTKEFFSVKIIKNHRSHGKFY